MSQTFVDAVVYHYCYPAVTAFFHPFCKSCFPQNISSPFDIKNTDAENDDTAKDDTSKAAANSTSGDGSEKAYGSQSGADKRTDAQNSKKRLHIPPVILKTSLCVIFLTALTAIIVYIIKHSSPVMPYDEYTAFCMMHMYSSQWIPQ